MQSPQQDLITITSSDDLARFKNNGRGIELYLVPNNHNSHSRLAISHELFDDLCSDLKTPNILKNMIIHMGFRLSDEGSPPIPCMRTSTGLIANDRLTICYVLLYPTLNDRESESTPFSIRRFVVHAEVRQDKNQASWIFIGRLPEIWFKDAVDLSRQQKSTSASSSFRLHQVLLQQTLASWRPYLRFLEKELGECDCLVAFSTPGGPVSKKLPGTLFRLDSLGRQVDESKAALENSARVLRVHRRLLEISLDPSSDTQDEIEFAAQHINMLIQQLETLRSGIKRSSKLASTFLLLNTAHASAKESTENLYEDTAETWVEGQGWVRGKV